MKRNSIQIITTHININSIFHIYLIIYFELSVFNRLMYSITNNYSQRSLHQATVISYSSGSSIFNGKYKLISLHHYGRPSRIAFSQDAKLGPTKIAEGIRISAIVKRTKYRCAVDNKMILMAEVAANASHDNQNKGHKK